MTKLLQLNIPHNLRIHTLTFRAALSRWGVGVGAVERGTGLSLTPDSPMLRTWWTCMLAVMVESTRMCVCEQRHTHQAAADVARLLRGRKPLSVAIDTVVISAAVAHFTTRTSRKET